MENKLHKDAEKKAVRDAKKYFAAIDLGSRNCRTIVGCQSKAGAFEYIETYSKSVSLADGVAASKKLSRKSMDRTIEALAFCSKVLSRYAGLTYLAVATDAMRRAENASVFIKRVKRELGLIISIITPQEEAYYAALGCIEVLSLETEIFVVFDIGGGSSEIALCRQKSDKDIELIDSLSIPYGVINLLESKDHLTFSGYSNLVQKISDLSRDFLNQYATTLDFVNNFQCIGTSGTTTTVAALNMNLRFYDREKINDSILQFSEILKTVHYVQSLSEDERKLHPYISQSNEDLVLGGLTILEGIVRGLPASTITVTDRGVRDGVVYALTHDKCKGHTYV